VQVDVLVVDDDEVIRRLVVTTLELADYKVKQAADGDSALAILERDPPRCVVLDVDMPKVNGFAVLKGRRQRRLAPKTRFLLVTGRTEEADFFQGYELGAVGYITKPFSPDDIVRRVGHILAASEAALESVREAEVQKAQLLRRMERAFTRRPPPS
jgi:DNA-binding response OmpR family regulator